MSYANITHACLEEAAMRFAVMRGSTLWDSDFKGADLKGAILTAAELCDCNFEAACLDSAELYLADLDYASFRKASLRQARLDSVRWSYYADFRDADVTGADFADCSLDGKSFTGAVGFHPHMRCPEEGSFIAWKKCRDDRIVKLLILESAKRTGAFVAQCRASEAIVLDIWDKSGVPCDEAVSDADKDIIYRKGKTVYPRDAFDDDLLTDGSGIHFFLTRTEAELYEIGDDYDDEDDEYDDDEDDEYDDDEDEDEDVDDVAR
ncbi:MAG: pentapeptide repeat-containing protein [Clostridia bacterium]|nr:pentapeptide repeat-containing protein [Clostridia bacterium]